jgi:tetratricopeptide (TPR) repeat protein
MTMLDALDALAGHSLVVVDTSREEPRFRMLETVREYAAELLASRDDAEAVAERHSACFVALAERLDAGLRGAEQGRWLARLERDHGNLRLVLRRLLDAGEHATVAFLARRLFLFWWLREHITEAAGWIDEAMASADDLEPAARLDLLWTASSIAMEVGDWDRSLALVTEALQIADTLDDSLMRGVCLVIHGFVSLQPEQLRAAAECFRADGEVFLAGLALTGVGSCDLLAGDVEAARTAHLESIEIARGIGNERLHAQATVLLAMDEMAAGDASRARTLLDEGLDRFLALESAEGIALTLSAYAWLGLLEGEPVRAATALAGAQVLRERAGLALWPLVRESEAMLEATIVEAVGGEEFAHHRAVARSRSRAELVAASRPLPVTGLDAVPAP